jgi:hypothetical protein
MELPKNERQVWDRRVETLCVQRWRTAGPALAAVRAEELRAMTDADALAAADSLLALAEPPRNAARWRTSGLVEQQRLFQRLRAARGRRAR